MSHLQYFEPFLNKEKKNRKVYCSVESDFSFKWPFYILTVITCTNCCKLLSSCVYRGEDAHRGNHGQHSRNHHLRHDEHCIYHIYNVLKLFDVRVNQVFISSKFSLHDGNLGAFETDLFSLFQFTVCTGQIARVVPSLINRTYNCAIMRYILYHSQAPRL